MLCAGTGGTVISKNCIVAGASFSFALLLSRSPQLLRLLGEGVPPLLTSSHHMWRLGRISWT